MASRDWIILRCSGGNTQKLARSLYAASYDVWTPMVANAYREGPSRARRKNMVPAMPTYVFARSGHLADLITETERLTSPHPDFSVFQPFGKIPLIADETLEPLRTAERKGRPLEQVHRFTKGEMVRLTEGGFAGMSGIVETTRGQFTMVCFPGFSMPVKIRTFLLAGDVAKDDLPLEGSAAKRAA